MYKVHPDCSIGTPLTKIKKQNNKKRQNKNKNKAKQKQKQKQTKTRNTQNKTRPINNISSKLKA